MEEHKVNLQARQVLQTFARRDFRDWHGLAPTTLLSDVTSVFETDQSWSGHSKLGANRRDVNWVNAVVKGYDHAVRVWAKNKAVVLMDVEWPILETNLEILLKSLGRPEAKLDSYLGVLPLSESEWVYPYRGLTLYVNPENGTLLRLAVYRSIGLDEYSNELRMDLQTKRLPPSRSNSKKLL